MHLDFTIYTIVSKNKHINQVSTTGKPGEITVVLRYWDIHTAQVVVDNVPTSPANTFL